MTRLNFNNKIGRQLGDILIESWREIGRKRTINSVNLVLSNDVVYSCETKTGTNGSNKYKAQTIKISMIKAFIPINIEFTIDVYDFSCILKCIKIEFNQLKNDSNNYKNKNIILTPSLNSIDIERQIEKAENTVIQYIANLLLSIDRSIKQESYCFLENEFDKYYLNYFRIYPEKRRQIYAYETIISLIGTLARSQKEMISIPVEYITDSYNINLRDEEIEGDSIIISREWLYNLQNSKNYTDTIVMILKEDKDYDYTGLF